MIRLAGLFAALVFTLAGQKIPAGIDCYHRDLNDPMCSGRPLEMQPIVIGKGIDLGFPKKAPVAPPTPVKPEPLLAPTAVRRGEVDWRFADPGASWIAGINFAAIQRSPLARAFAARIGASRGIDEDALARWFDHAADIERIGFSSSGGQIVVLLAGSFANAKLPPAGAGTKVLTVAGGALLIGDAAAVDRAAARLGLALPDSAAMRQARALDSSSADAWIFGSPNKIGVPMPGANRMAGAAFLRDRFFVDLAFQFETAAAAALAASRQSGEAEGAVLHLRFPDEMPNTLTGYLGDALAAMHHLPERPAAEGLRPLRPTVAGLNQ